MTRTLMLDTNAAGAVIRGAAPSLDERLATGAACISVVTEAELRFGLARRPERAALSRVVEAFLSQVTVLPWTSDCAKVYATLRARLEADGTPLGALDLLIAAHALEAGCSLASQDRAFARVPGLGVEAWS